jgi:hypothetical protein
MRKWWLGSICLSAAASIWGGMYVVSKVVLNTHSSLGFVGDVFCHQFMRGGGMGFFGP